MSKHREGWSMDVKVGECVHFDVPPGVDSEKISITLESKSGQLARIRVEADRKAVKVSRPSKRDFAPQT